MFYYSNPIDFCPKKYLLRVIYVPYGKPNGKQIRYHSDGNVKVVYKVKNRKIIDGNYKHTSLSKGTEHKEVRYKNNIASTHSVVMRSKTNTVRYINANHDLNKKNVYEFV